MDFINGINTIEFGVGSLNGIIKLLFLVLAFGYIVYVFLLTLRVRILSETVKTPSNSTAKLISYIHLFLAVVGSLLAVILILLG